MTQRVRAPVAHQALARRGCDAQVRPTSDIRGSEGRGVPTYTIQPEASKYQPAVERTRADALKQAEIRYIHESHNAWLKEEQSNQDGCRQYLRVARATRVRQLEVLATTQVGLRVGVLNGPSAQA
jgi:sarcosine oxidase delta subunit